MTKTTRRQLLDALVITCVPVVAAVLIQRPDLRAALVMRLAHTGRRLCQAQADFWQVAATSCAQAYNRARL